MKILKSETYAEAARYIREHGLHKGRFIDPEGGVKACMLGACYLAEGALVNRGGLFAEAYIAGGTYAGGAAHLSSDFPELFEVVGARYGVSVPYFNDHRASKTSAYNLLRAAHRLAKEREAEQS